MNVRLERYFPSAPNREPDNSKRFAQIREAHGLEFDVTQDNDEAKQIVAELIEKGRKIYITVPEQYIDHVRQFGINPVPQVDRTGAGENYTITAGRLGSDPYLNEKEDRYVIEVDPAGLPVLPRFTGPDRIFAGTVAVDGFIPPDHIIVLGKFNKNTYPSTSPKAPTPPDALAA